MAAVIFLLNTSITQAVDNYWNVATGNWSDTNPSPWSLGTEPTSSDNAYIQNGGTANITKKSEACNNLYLGATASGTINMTDGSLSAYCENIGYSGTGTFTQTGGNNPVLNTIYLGYNSGSTGTYYLSGTGQLSAPNDEIIGYSGTGTFTQTGGTNTNTSQAYGLYLAYNSGSNGIYNLIGTGQLSTNNEYIGNSGTGTFTQTGGTNSITGSLYLGYNSGSSGIFSLSGSGQLSVPYTEYIGYSGTGTFMHAGGTNTVPYIKIGTNGSYMLAGGTVNINGGIENQGILDLSNSSAVINASSSIVDLSKAKLANAGNASLNLDSHSLLIVPTGFDPTHYFVNYTNAGILHQAGSALDISSSYSIYGIGSINDHVDCQGTLSPTSSNNINLNSGLTITGAGSVNLGYGNLYVNDTISGMDSGSLITGNQYIGDAGTGTFTQSGGTNSISTYSSFPLYLGNKFGSSGMYNLSNSGNLSAYYEYIGYSGTGTFTQTGGTNSTSYSSNLGYNSGSTGTYNLSGTGQLTSRYEYIGYSGTGIFNHISGTNTITGTDSGLNLGYNSGATGTYNLSGTGQLSAKYEYIGKSGTGTFTQNGGTNSVTSYIYLGYSSGSSGTYSLSGDGQLSATSELIGPAGTGMFTQTGGNNTVSYIKIYANGTYNLAAGKLNVNNGGISNSGVWDLTNSSAVINATSSFVDITSAILTNAGNVSLNLDSHSLLIVPSGFNPANYFNNYTNTGILHQAGSVLDITSAYAIYGSGSINDHVNCQGTLFAISGSSINLNGGLTIVDAGNVNLGYGNLYVNDAISGMSGGSLHSYAQYVGANGTGIFTQRGGTNSSSYYFHLGYSSGSYGTYNLSDTGNLFANYGYVGNSGTGTFTQSDTANVTIGFSLYLGNNSGSTGTYNLNSTASLIAGPEYIGYSGSGIFSQINGTNAIYTPYPLYLGYNSGSAGTYNLSGTGQLSVSAEYIGYSGTGTFEQNSGTNSFSFSTSIPNLYLGYNSGSSGSYNLHGTGQLSGAMFEYIGYSSTGTFTQTGGTNTSQILCLGCNSGSIGFYNLSSSGQLSATAEYIGVTSYPGVSGTGMFTQTGGTNTASYIKIGAKGIYTLAGGIVNINGGIENQGVWDLSNSSASINASSSIIDLSCAILNNAKNVSLNLDSNSLLIVPSGFNPANYFNNYTNTGILHQTGSVLDISSSNGIYGSGSISDHVNCYGTVSANALINLNGGLTILGMGNVNLKSGNLYVNDAISGMSGGSLNASYQYYGSTGTGTFTQTGGINSMNWSTIYVGYSSGATGMYNLSGTAQLSAGGETIGISGTGTFTQTGGTNSISSDLSLGINSGSSGTYNLSGTGTLTTTNYEYIGKSGVGIFTHTGGTNSISQYYLYLGYNAGSSGTYNLSGTGKLSAEYAYVGNSGSGIFTQTGGTNSIINNLYIGYNPSSIGTYNLSAGTNSSGSLYLGYYSGSNGTYYLNGTGQLTVIGNEYIGYTGTGIFSQTGGTNHIYGELYLCTNPGSIGTYNLNGGTLILYSLSQGSDTTVFNFGGGTLQVSSSFTSSLPIILTGDGGNANIDTAGYAVTLSGPLSGSGGLNKLDSGTLTLSGSNSYNGNTFIKAGKLSLSSTGSIGSTPIIDILSGATFDVSAKNGFTLGGMQSLMGRGTVLGGVVATPGSQIVPGDSAGILTISGNLTLNSGALLDFELANTSASDKISMTGSTLYLNNQQFSDFVFTPLGGFGAGTYILIDAGGIQGNLGNSLSGNIGGLPASLSTSGNDLVLNVVPEPSIWILLATAGLALFAYVRRQ